MERTTAGEEFRSWRKLHKAPCTAIAAKAGIPGLAHRILRWEWGEIDLTDEEKDAIRQVMREWDDGDVPWWAK